MSLSTPKWLSISLHLQMTLGTASARVYAKNENKVHYLWPSLWDSLVCVRKVELLGNTLLPPGFLASLKVVLIFVNNLGFIHLISCQETKSFCNAHSFRLCISWRFEEYLPLFGVVLFSFCWHQRKAGWGCEQGTACCVQCQGLLPCCAACLWVSCTVTPWCAFKMGAVTLCLALLSSWSS